MLYTLLPVLWLVLAATKNVDALFSSDLLSLSDFSFVENVKDLFAMDKGLYGRWYLNSLLYAVVGAAVSAFISHRLRATPSTSTTSATRRSSSAWCWPR